VGQDQRQRTGPGRANVQEVDLLAVDLGGELRVGVQPRLRRAPVELLQPVPRERPDALAGLAVAVARAGQFSWPQRVAEPAVEVLEGFGRDIDAERPDLAVTVVPVRCRGLSVDHLGLLLSERNISFRLA
jgi:hypothetical protein